VRVDLAHDERHVGVHAPGAGVVDDDGARLGEAGRVRAAAGRPGREEGDVDAAELGRGDILDGHGLAAEHHVRSGRAGRRERPELAHREPALLENVDHRAADLAGGADDGDGES
jgi:hypothetical protein